MKYLITLILALLFLISGKAQSWERLSEKYEELYDAKRYSEAVMIGEKVIVAAKKEFGEINYRYTSSLVEIVDLYSLLGQYKKAELNCLKLVSVEKKRGEDSEGYLESLKRLGHVYVELGEYVKAEPLFLQVSSILKNWSDKRSRIYTNTLNDLAVLYGDMGQYDKAELYLIETKEIYRELNNSNNTGYATCLSNLGYLYEILDQLEKAESLYIQAKDIREKLLGVEHLDYANSLNSLGGLYADKGEYEKSEAYLIQAMQIRKKIFGVEHLDYANSLQSLGYLYEKKKEYLSAEPLYNQAADIDKKLLGENHPSYAADLYNLAMLNIHLEKYQQAETYLLQSQQIKKRILGENHPSYINALSSIGLLYIFMGQYSKAEPTLIEYGASFLEKVKNIFLNLSEKEKNNILRKIELLEINENFLYNFSKASSEFKKINFNLHLFFKSLSLTDTKRKLDQVRYSKDTLIKKIFNEFQSTRSILAMQYSLPLNRRREDLKKIEELAESQEKELNRRSSTYRNEEKELSISLTDVQKQISDNEVTIEFTSFELYNGSRPDSIIFGAYILSKKNSAPLFIPLCEEKQLQELFDSAGTTATAMVNKFYRGLDVKNKNTTGILGTELYKLIWQPLEPYLKGVKKISYSPAGKLYGIAFHALPVGNDSLLMEKYSLQQYTSTRQVALRNGKSENIKPTNITMFGDANFSMDSVQLTKQRTVSTDSFIAASIYTPSTRVANNKSWPNLPGTAAEVKKINDLFNQNKLSTKSFTQTTASEENLKALSGNSPQILHIATHGFFLPEPDKKRKENSFNSENTYTLADDPLLRSGLILAGGNYAWSGKTPIEGVEDGIATAYEISQLNLSNTELVVLSACETALGDVKGSEGVFGLQRAFKMAGVKKMIVSLWQVPDKETAELMTTFYTYWMKGKTINDAFAQAQADMRKKYSPFYWAAFVLVE